jgi:predicted amidohydrolase YtcJ
MDGEESAYSLAVVNARVWTGAARRRWADALLARGGRIATVGSSAEVMKRVDGGTRVVDAGGCFVYSGSLDSGRTLERGQLADFVMLDRDIVRVTLEDIAGARVVMNVAGGRVIQESQGG